MVIAPVVVGIIWRLLYGADVGLFSFAVNALTGRTVNVLSNPTLALPALILVDVWEWTPFMFLLLLAGIQSLPQEPFEAARVDGAGPWNVFLHLILPMLRPVIVVAILIRALDAFTVFGQIFLLTGGGPGTATTSTTLFAFFQGFQNFNVSYGATIGWIGAIVMCALAFVAHRLLRSESYV